jgi:hypothetical protein
LKTQRGKAWWAICLLENDEVQQAGAILAQLPVVRIDDTSKTDLADAALVRVARARWLMQEGRDEQAADLLLSAEPALVQRGADLEITLRYLVDVCERLGRRDQAARWRQRQEAPD